VARTRKTAGTPASLRAARRERRRDLSRQEILAATRKVLLRQGIRATTLEAVAAEVGLTKAALYYYFPSKDALFFEVVYGIFEDHARAVHDAVEPAARGGQALRALIGETIRGFARRMDDFRLAFLHAQVAGPGGVEMSAEQFARIRPLNNLTYAGTAGLLASDEQARRGNTRPAVPPRLLTFVAHAAALGVLTIKGMVESVGDPLLYSDEQLIDALATVFEAAAR
jgi:AcrR family transcriptional regulator